ncbi:Mov34/MPN/PAD-1 family protein [Sphingomonas sp.]|uniref:Mov34/MPN/PAD-1 family protein n=1 Tax=Sphingomonas sp. TaxID=28214 RepID=UPI002B913606|nr:Mov34/MPN/PAD-1 family protein [Sphingomonas sp.]HTG37562.1 Mov34/MPN/PAD-1 family protein [Sphingomonas sp.]
MSKVILSSAAIGVVTAAARAAHPLEACGLLLGAGERVEQASVAANVAASPRDRFEIDPAHLLAAHRAARGGGLGIQGYWHSHPNGDPRPSATDAAMADPDGRLWAIVAGGDMRLYRAVAAGDLHGRFVAVAWSPGDPSS